MAGCFITSPSSQVRDYLHKVEANVYPSLSYSSLVDADCNTFNPFSQWYCVFYILTLDSGGGWILYGGLGSYHNWITNDPKCVVETVFIAFFYVSTTGYKDVYASGKSVDCFGEHNT